MTGYKYEVWVDATGHREIYCARVTDPFGEFVGEVKSLAEFTALRMAHELKKGDPRRYKLEHGVY